MSLQSITDSYALEILARAREGQARCERLVGTDFVSEAPRHLANTLLNIFRYFERLVPEVCAQIDWTGNSVEIENDCTILRTIDANLKEFGSHIRYVESGRTDRVPWHVIPAFEHLVRELTPDARILFRPMWRYNYATVVVNVRDLYLEALQSYEYFLPDTDIESKVIYPLGAIFHIISFPAIERDNILLHSLIGHEIGHLAVRDFVARNASNFLDDVRSEIEQQTDSDLRSAGITKESMGIFFESTRTQEIARNSNLCRKFWSRGLEEILSDAVGALLFGPAVLFSTLEIAAQFGFDLSPTESNDYYPPWRMRLREVLRVVDSEGPELLIPSDALFRAESPSGLEPIPKAHKNPLARSKRVAEYIETIRSLAGNDTDRKAINRQTFARIAYEAVERYIRTGVSELRHQLGELVADPTRIRNLLPTLIERLDAGVTPNAEHDSPTKELSRLRVAEPLNAAWFHKVSLPSITRNSKARHALEEIRGRRNRLTLKAIEFADLARRYPAPKQRKAPPVASESQHGVQTAPDLRRWMQLPEVAERLIVTPLFDQHETIGASSVDVRLGTEFILFRKEGFSALDVTASESMTSYLERYQQRIVRRLRDPIVLHPGQLVIGSTLEYIQIPPGLLAYVIGKSTWGRTGLVIATATKVDPGFRGCITLEIINEGEVPLVVVPGVPIAQLVFHTVHEEVRYEGSYSCPIGPEFPRFDAMLGRSTFWLPET